MVPPVHQIKVLKELHCTHPRMVQMKSLAQANVWWPNIDHSECMTVMPVKVSEINPQLQCSTHGPGLNLHGRGYMLNLWGLLWV